MTLSQITEELNQKRIEARKALTCLYITVDADVAQDVHKRVEAVFEAYQSQANQLLEMNGKLVEALQSFVNCQTFISQNENEGYDWNERGLHDAVLTAKQTLKEIGAYDKGQ